MTNSSSGRAWDQNRRQFLQTSSLVVGAAGIMGAQGLWSLAQAQGITFPNKVREIENIWIPMSDGTRLAARLWLPEGAEEDPVPCILNYCPYHKRNRTRQMDDQQFPYYAGHGYACIRVDIRGSGDSDGLPQDEYVQQELDDGVEIIAWIAAQPWCSGTVGMEGISWSGFNSLQIAALRPPALKAIITHDSTDDRYADDAHYKGGCIVHEMFGWGTQWFTNQGLPGDPEICGGDNWLNLWRERLDAVEFNLGNWMQHQHRDAFWKHGSVCEDYSKIECAVYAISGWVDGYKNSVFRLLQNLKCPRKGLVGPWNHGYPHVTVPGPNIDYLNEALRWWDYWLKGKDTGIMNEPMLRVWTQDKTACCGELMTTGQWAAEDTWPSPRLNNRRYYLNTGTLDTRAGRSGRVELNPLQTVGLASSNWCPFDMATELPLDQRIDDGRSLTFDSEPLTDDLEIVGAPVVTLELAVDRPVAFVAVRLNQVWPSGEVRRVTYGILNLCHRDSHEFPEPLVPGKRYRIPVKLDYCAHRFSRGSRLRVAVSTTFWPMIVPSPEPVVLAVFTGASTLELPVRPARPEDKTLRDFGPPVVPQVKAKVTSPPAQRTVTWDVVSGTQTLAQVNARGSFMVEAVNTEIQRSFVQTDIIRDNDPTSAVIDFQFMMGFARGSWQPKVETSTRFTLTRDTFNFDATLKATQAGEEVRTRNWKLTVPRQLV